MLPASPLVCQEPCVKITASMPLSQSLQTNVLNYSVCSDTSGGRKVEPRNLVIKIAHNGLRSENDLDYNATEKSVVKKRAWVPSRCLFKLIRT